ncbi:MAG: rRNA (adenine1518-N6/adenine1519-N6)-dimethyltransferase [Verrucomicrobiota bacterium]
MKLSEINRTLQEIHVSPVKSLGQNFLHDRNLARWIVDQAGITSNDYAVEIGPGLGALTEIILATGASVLAIEKDARLARFLQEKFHGRHLEVVHADALKFDMRTLYRQARVKLIGNLPYYVSSQLLLKFVNYPSPISLWVLMLQKELARRLSALPSTPDYGALTLQIQLHHRVEYLRAVSANVFIPRPEVDSALVMITPRAPAELPAVDFVLFNELVRRGFSQRRKQVGKLLAHYISDWEQAAETLGLDRQVRAEAISLEQWIALTNYARPVQAPEGNRVGEECFPVVDDTDQIIEEASRARVHGDNLRHRAVHILIFSKNKEVLLQKRTRWKDRHPNLWDSSAAGHVNTGEEYDDAACRELKEELGIETTLERVAKLPASPRTDEEFIWIYRGNYDGELKTEPSEIETTEFFPLDVVDAWVAARPKDFATAFLDCWKRYRET